MSSSAASVGSVARLRKSLALLCAIVSTSLAWAAPQRAPGEKPPFSTAGAGTLVVPGGASLPFGVARLHDAVTGWGPGYRVRFHDRGVVLATLPSSGSREAGLLQWTLTSVGRRSAGGAATMTPVALTQRGVAEGKVCYAYDACVESYEATLDGVEQSFTFTALPPGEGDLVVRGRIDSKLTPSPRGECDRMQLGGAGESGIAIGAVRGIDARGRVVRGTMCCADDSLEYRLPAAFIETAALPIVLDPLIGPAFQVAVCCTSFASAPYGDSDVAYDPGSDVFLVLWNEFSDAPFGI